MTSFDEALANYRSGDWDSAKKTLDRLLSNKESVPDMAPVLRAWIAALLRENNVLSTLLEEWAERQSKNKMWSGLGALSYLRQNKISKAKALAETAISSLPHEAMAWAIWGVTLGACGQKNDALVAFDRAFKIDAGAGYAYLWRARFHYANRDDAAALNDVRRAVTLMPQLTEGWEVLGQLSRDAGLYSEAINAYQIIHERRREDLDILNQLGYCLWQDNQLEKAAESFEFIVASDKNHWAAWVNLGGILIAMYRYDEAKKACLKALSLCPEGIAEVFSNLAKLSQLENDLDQALVYIDKAIELQPKNGLFYLNKATILVRLNRVAEAASACRKCLARDKNQPKAHLLLGISFLNERKASKAVEHFRLGLNLPLPANGRSPAHRECALYLAIQSWVNRKYPDARELLKYSMPLMDEVDYEYRGPKIYLNYLGQLLNWWVKRPPPPVDEVGVLCVIGESHSLSPQETRFKTPYGLLRCQSHWIQGCKMWHLAQKNDTLYKKAIEIELRSLPPEMPVMFTIGEIDCRPNEGIWQVFKKTGTDLESLIENTVTGYLGYLQRVCSAFGSKSRSIIIHGIPAPAYDYVGDMSPGEDVDKFQRMIALVNEKLKKNSLQKGWLFLDVYAATIHESGRSHGKWHLDGFHLQPGFYQQADQWLIKP